MKNDKNTIEYTLTLNNSQLHIDVSQVKELFKDVEVQTKSAYQALLDAYQDYATQRAALEKKAATEIAELEKLRTPDTEAQIDRTIPLIKQGLKNGLSQLNMTEFKDGINWDSLFGSLGSLDKVTTKTLVRVRDELRKYMVESKDALSSEALLTLTNAYDKLNTKLKDEAPGKTVSMALGNLKVIRAELEAARAELKAAQRAGEEQNTDGNLNQGPARKNEQKAAKKEQKAVEKTTKKEQKAAKNPKVETKMTEAEAAAQQKVSDALDKRREAQLTLNEALLGYAANAREGLDAGNAMIGTLETFGVEIPAELKGALEGVGEVLGGLESINFTNPMSIITGGLKAIAGLGKVFNSLFGGDSRKEREIQSLQKTIDKLKKSYEELDEQIEKSFSTDASDKLDENNENLEKQNELIAQQIKKEKSKKGTDNAKIKEWQAQIEKNNEQIEKNKTRALDAIFGQDLQTAIGDFAQAYADAWAAGTDRAESMKDVVKNMIKNVVVEMLKSDLAPTVEGLRARIKEMLVDGMISDAEQIELDRMVERMMGDVDKNDYSWADKYMKDSSADGRQAVAKGIATASQQSVDENNGLLTAMQGFTSEININVQTLVANSTRALNHLAGIEQNTTPLVRLERISDDIRTMKESIHQITLKGIAIR